MNSRTWAALSLKRNLIKNPCADEKFDHWSIVENGGDCWKIEDLIKDKVDPFPKPSVNNYFVTSFRTCKKSQLIDLGQEGYSAEVMDQYQPPIVISDWFSGSVVSGCQYELLVRLLSKDKSTLHKFCPKAVIIPEKSDGKWRNISHSFSHYGPGVRYISFQHGGKSTKHWAGWYGVRIVNSSITIEL